MSRACSIPGCAFAQQWRYFPFPVEKKSSPALTKRRLDKWISVLGLQPDFDPTGKWVCGIHFVGGSPAKDTDLFDIDWVPTLNFPTCTTELNVKNDPDTNSIESAYPEENAQPCDENTPTMTMCRACGIGLSDDPAFSDSFENLAHLYFEFTYLQLHPHENTEELRICLGCKNKLHEFEQLRETFINVHWSLLEAKTKLQDSLHKESGNNSVDETNSSTNKAINSIVQDAPQNSHTSEQLESIVKVEPEDYCSEDNVDDDDDDESEQESLGYSFQIKKESNSESVLSTSSSSDDNDETLPPEKKKKKSLHELYPFDKSQRKKFFIPRKRKKFQRHFDCRCPRKCSTLFSSEKVLENFFDKYWESIDKASQKKMVSQYVRSMPVRRIRCRPTRIRPERVVMFQYFIPTEDGEVRVCQKFFLGIVQTTSGTVYRYVYGRTGDRKLAHHLA